MPKHTVKLTYKMSEFIEIEAPTEIDAIVKAGTMLMKGELHPTHGKGELQQGTAHIEMPPEKKAPNCS